VVGLRLRLGRQLVLFAAGVLALGVGLVLTVRGVRSWPLLCSGVVLVCSVPARRVGRAGAALRGRSDRGRG